jgi:hypothetical protein
MAVYRDSPVPVGRYWLDLIGPEQAARWAGYQRSMGDDRVRVVSTEHHDAIAGSPGIPAAPARDFVIFDVLKPVVYDHSYLPSPEIAPGVTSESETVQKPEPEPSLSLPTFSGVGKGIETGLFVVGGAIVALTAVVAVVYLSKRRNAGV